MSRGAAAASAGTHPSARQVEGCGARARRRGARRHGALGTARKAEDEQEEDEEKERGKQTKPPPSQRYRGGEFGGQLRR